MREQTDVEGNRAHDSGRPVLHRRQPRDLAGERRGQAPGDQDEHEYKAPVETDLDTEDPSQAERGIHLRPPWHTTPACPDNPAPPGAPLVLAARSRRTNGTYGSDRR